MEIKTKWLLFGLMVLTNALLAWATLPAWGAFLFFLAGVGVPLAFLWKGLAGKKSGADLLLHRDFFPGNLAVVWAVLFLCAFTLRFFQLTQLSGWPNSDEAWHGIFAVNLMKHWQWNLLYGVTHMPPGYFWLSSLFFKVFGVSLASLWFLPALLSFLAFLGFAFAARAFFSKSVALIFAGLMGLTYWPLIEGRMSHPGVLAFAWEALCCVLLAFLAAAARGAGRQTLFFLLGLGVGSGFYTFTCWWSAAVVFSAAALYAAILTAPGGTRARSTAAFGLYSVGLILTASPFMLTVIQGGYSGYFSSLLLFRDAGSFEYGWRTALSYLTLLFWGKDLNGNAWPPWLVFLNPLWASAFFSGVLVILRSRRSPFAWFLLGSIPVFLAPGLATISIEPFRVIPVLPALLGVAAIGVLWLLNPLPSFKWRTLLGAVALLAFAGDVYFLIGPYHQRCGKPSASSREFKSVERWRAFHALQEQARREGPGLILTDFILKPFDQTLNIASYSFDWLRNPALERRTPSWLAVLANPHFLPLLEKRFPNGRWAWLSQNLGAADGGLFLAVIPTGDFSPAQLDRWMKANQGFRAMTLNMLYQADKRGGREIFGELKAVHPLVKDDGFLESCYWHRSAFDNVLVGDIDGALAAVQSGLKCSGPNAFFYDQMGLMYWKKGDRRKAAESFQKALDCPLNLTFARQNLDALNRDASLSRP